MSVIELKREESIHPRREYVTGIWRVQLDKHPREDRWDWMIETQDNGPVYWHRTTDEPSYEEINEWIKTQDWS
jgi:hypothetical protein